VLPYALHGKGKKIDPENRRKPREPESLKSSSWREKSTTATTQTKKSEKTRFVRSRTKKKRGKVKGSLTRAVEGRKTRLTSEFA